MQKQENHANTLATLLKEILRVAKVQNIELKEMFEAAKGLQMEQKLLEQAKQLSMEFKPEEKQAAA